MAVKFDNRPSVTYAGDATGSIGEIKGPGYDGRELLAVDQAVYAAPFHCRNTACPVGIFHAIPGDPEAGWCPDCGTDDTAPAAGRGFTRVWFRYATQADVLAAQGNSQPDMATPQFDLPTWLVGAAGYTDFACALCSTPIRQHGISDGSKAWGLCSQCLATPAGKEAVNAKRREIREDAQRAQRDAIDGAQPAADATGTRSPVTIFILGLADGQPSPFDRTWLVEYDPTRPGVTPDGQPMTAHIRVTTNREEAARFPHAGAAWEEWRRESGHPYPRNAPLTAFTVVFTPEDVPEPETGAP